MTYNSKRYQKSYALGYKPTVVLRKQLERTLIKDIELMKNEISRLESKRFEYLVYKERRILFEQQEQLINEPLKEKMAVLLSQKSNYETGIKFWFRKKELKDDIRLEIETIVNRINQNLSSLENKYKIKQSPFDGYKLKSDEIDGRIDYEINRRINHYSKAIRTYQNELELKQNKNQQLENIKGIAAQALNKTRQRANQIKSNIIISDICPYCGDLIEEAHVDHIYPVAKGGLSSTKNMVRVCSDCNMKKKDLTLNQFIRKYNLDREFIEKTLDMLNKTY